MSMLGLIKMDQSFVGPWNESWSQRPQLIEVRSVRWLNSRAKQLGPIRMEQRNKPWLQDAEEQRSKNWLFLWDFSPFFFSLAFQVLSSSFFCFCKNVVWIFFRWIRDNSLLKKNEYMFYNSVQLCTTRTTANYKVVQDSRIADPLVHCTTSTNSSNIKYQRRTTKKFQTKPNSKSSSVLEDFRRGAPIWTKVFVSQWKLHLVAKLNSCFNF